MNRLKAVVITYACLLLLAAGGGYYYLRNSLVYYKNSVKNLKVKIRQEMAKTDILMAYVKAAERLGYRTIEDSPPYLRGISDFEEGVNYANLDFTVRLGYSSRGGLKRAKKELFEYSDILKFVPFTITVNFGSVGVVPEWLSAFCNELKDMGALVGQVSCRNDACLVSGLLVTKKETKM